MVNASENDRLVWIDCEMTGLDLAVDELVEIAVVITDFELNVLDPGFQIVIKPDASALANMGEFVTEMHRSSGLLDEIPHGVSLQTPSSRCSSTSSASLRPRARRRWPATRSAPTACSSRSTCRASTAGCTTATSTFRASKRTVAPLVPARLLPGSEEERRAPRPGRHPRVDPRARLLPRRGLRAAAGPHERRSEGRLGLGRVVVRTGRMT